ncbi:acyltransferase family protein [Ornithinimicrobium sediminis]|uniref:acyltransferase family protein n=1 Tax=Ornithinimicrobium sediminis TaxID=2904603 RepID=UPI001E57A1F2|nr:acyltransferase family protein [Ornithinimicrobium sediminis]MCE0488233.1 hypothetical protein [Ornithinimicrobium sediminis]
MSARSKDLWAGEVPADPTQPDTRDVVIDVVRVLSLAVVVALHCVYVRLTLVDGDLVAQTAIGGPVIAALTWVLQVMPLFFVAAGFANTRMVDRCAREGTSATSAQALRLRRLLSPLALLVLLLLGVSLMLAWVDPAAALTVGAEAGAHLWFVTAYLLCLALAPVMVGLQDRWGMRTVAVLVAGALAVDTLRYAGLVDADTARFPGFALVWLACHQLGIAYARGVLRRRPAHQVLGVAVTGALVLVLMVQTGPYPSVTIGLADAPVSNLAPPTAVLAVLAVVQFALVTLAGRAVETRHPPAVVGATLLWLTPRMVPIYLWHVPVLAGVSLLGLLAPEVLLPDDAATWWLHRPLWLALAALVLWPVLGAAAAWDRQLSHLPLRTDRIAVVGASLLGVVGAAVLWRIGVTPTVGSVSACLAVVLAVTLLVRPDRPTARG